MVSVAEAGDLGIHYNYKKEETLMSTLVLTECQRQVLTCAPQLPPRSEP